MLRATEYSTVADKQEFLDAFKAFVKANFDRKLFTEKFYHRLNSCRGHIAEYDRGGFYSTWFGTPADKVRFIKRWISAPIYGDPAFTFSDVESELKVWLEDNNWYERQLKREQQENEKLRLAAIAERERKELLGNVQEYKVLAKSRNVGAFGHKGYIVCSRDGTTYEVQKSIMSEWNEGDVIKVELDVNKNPIFHGCECVSRRVSAPADVLKQIWK